MAVVKARGLSVLPGGGAFVPYVYGAASGRPSKGRPEKVLANPDLPEAVVRVLERVPFTPVRSPGRAASAGCGTPAAARRHYRHGEACQACGVRTGTLP